MAESKRSFWLTPNGIAAMLLIAATTYFLLMEHRAHVVAALLTLVMFPILVYVYVRLARREEAVMEREYGQRYRAYAARTPAFVPRLATAEGDRAR